MGRFSLLMMKLLKVLLFIKAESMVPLRDVDPAKISNRIHNHDLFFKLIALFKS
jgi:hypothetical protein